MTDTQVAAMAGGYFVAYKIASLGFVPALVWQGARGVDLLASRADGQHSVALQVKCAFCAARDSGNESAEESFQLRFPLGHRAISGSEDATIFCFVDLRMGNTGEGPVAYVVTAKDLKKEYDGIYIRKYAYFSHDRPIAAMEQYRDNWQPLISALANTGSVEEKTLKAVPTDADFKPLVMPRTRKRNTPFGTETHQAFNDASVPQIVRAG